jgi:hypothetical protein
MQTRFPDDEINRKTQKIRDLKHLALQASVIKSTISTYNSNDLQISFSMGPSGVLAGGAGGPRPPQLAILGGRKNEKGAPIPRRILKVGGKKRI